MKWVFIHPPSSMLHLKSAHIHRKNKSFHYNQSVILRLSADCVQSVQLKLLHQGSIAFVQQRGVDISHPINL